ncbi:unnamed protein product [Ectocarpus sp. CCAP 1310/34]|nr:unnamed protein product [Ectocarpus sp. CCAP 1310/34]
MKNTCGDRPEPADPAYESPYDISTHWVARDGNGLRGRVEIAETYEGQDLDAWRNVIGVRDTEGTKEKGRLSMLKEKAAKLMLKVVFGFRGPADNLGRRGELSCEMKRSPSGHFEVLYLDEEIWVTRGHKGTLVVVTRVLFFYRLSSGDFC